MGILQKTGFLTPKRATLILKWLLGLYIFLCLVIAGLNYGLSKNVDDETA